MRDVDDGSSGPTTLERVPSGIPGLDVILRGGFFRGGVYMVLARPGAGKTILGNHICFRHVASGGRALFVTLLTESHGRMLAQMRNLAFFDPKVIGKALLVCRGLPGARRGWAQGPAHLDTKGRPRPGHDAPGSGRPRHRGSPRRDAARDEEIHSRAPDIRGHGRLHDPPSHGRQQKRRRIRAAHDGGRTADAAP